MSERQVLQTSYCDLREPVRFFLRRLWKRYANQLYKVSFRYPRHWQQVTDERYEGRDGFFQISAISARGPLSEVCRNEAYRRLQPYGSKPTMERFRYRGRRACLIFPSDDQTEAMKNQAAFIVEYPRPVLIHGQSYN